LLPGLLAFGPGLGASTVVGSIAALSGVGEADAGVASGTNTGAFQLGVSHLTDGFRCAFLTVTMFAVVGLIVAVSLLRKSGRLNCRRAMARR